MFFAREQALPNELTVSFDRLEENLEALATKAEQT